MLNRIVQPAKTIAIGGHVRPDGDCVGSCMGLYQYLKENYPEKEVDVYLEPIHDRFCFIHRSEEIRHVICNDRSYDLFICLDCGDMERLGFSKELFQNAKDTFCIDHHISNDSFAANNYIYPEASSTSELVYDLIKESNISKEVAEALYLGIVHDTGVFQYSSTAPSTMRAAAELLEKGIDASWIIQKTFYEKTYAQYQIMGRALLESHLLLDGRCIVSYIGNEDMKFFHVTAADLDGIVSELRNTKDVEVAVFMYEIEPNVYKISLRSGDLVDVSAIAQSFGGGGHKKAAGFSMTGTPQEIMKHLSAHISEQLEKKA